ncbi:unnamed protein product [Adineta ricciae]|uniref:C2H2-type domain-containing protein n=2 Tax=Adineta ricciae TaxID=249248 RepID=A0A814KRS5_ADIRI|nr:unnamed protein product [Adineta ricciae]
MLNISLAWDSTTKKKQHWEFSQTRRTYALVFHSPVKNYLNMTEQVMIDTPAQPTGPDNAESLSSSTSEVKSKEVTANPDFITWRFPPYCELCNVTFTSEANSKIHFENNGHKNKLHTWEKYQEPKASSDEKNSKTVLCDVCWKEMNTQAVLDIHLKSPAHLKLAQTRLVIQKLKEDYRQIKESQENE